MSAFNLFCFPFAGASRYSYSGYGKGLAPDVNLVSFDLPGRGGRSGESLLGDIDLMADDLFTQLKGSLSTPYALYGHSMDAVLGCLVARKVLAGGLARPLHLFVSGAGGPADRQYADPMHLLPKAKFIAALKNLGGSPDEVLSDDEIMGFFAPILLADFRAIETYRHQKAEPFDIPITCMIGSKENITLAQAELWQRETTAPLQLITYPGNHFFIFENEKSIVDTMVRTMRCYGTARSVSKAGRPLP